MSSQDVPAPDVFEQLTSERLIRSLRSDTCPLCAGGKAPGRSLCTECWRRTPAGLRGALYRHMDEGYDGAMLAVLRFHKGRYFFLPEDGVQPIHKLRLAYEDLTTPVLVGSVTSNVCPHCVGAKVPGQALCNVCLSGARAAIALRASRRRATAGQVRRQTDALEKSIEPARLTIDADGYARAIARVIRLLHGNTFSYPEAKR